MDEKDRIVAFSRVTQLNLKMTP